MFDVGGQIFLRLLQMVVVPLVMASVMSGILGLGDVRKLGRPGGYAITYYMTTTLMAVGTGLLIVNIVNPGIGLDKKLVEGSREDGSHAVDHASGAGENSVMVKWDNGAGSSQSEAGASDWFAISEKKPQQLELTIRQRGQADQEAEVTVIWSKANKTEEEHKEAETEEGEPFKAGLEAGAYKKKLKFPEDARSAQLVFKPQEGGKSSVLEARLLPGPPSIGDILQNLLLMLFTSNLLHSMVNMDLLPLIVFSLVFAGMLTTMGKQSEAIANLVVSINDALMNFILLLMRVAPIGIFCLVAARFGIAQSEGKFVDLLFAQMYYIITVLLGLGVHAFITLPLILYVFTRRNPFVFMRQMSQAVLTAFSTASSTATLPVTMECAETNAGVSKRSTEFVLPLGATINMDGTALYEAAAAIFIAQAYQIINPEFELTLLSQLTIAITATLAAIGAAGIPEAGLVTMLIVLNAVGLPLELIGLILPVDWLLDRFRTAVNAFGDSVGAAIVDGSFEEEATA